MFQGGWGSNSDYDDHMHDALGWNNFIILQWGNDWKPINHPFDTEEYESVDGLFVSTFTCIPVSLVQRQLCPDVMQHAFCRFCSDGRLPSALFVLQMTPSTELYLIPLALFWSWMSMVVADGNPSSEGNVRQTSLQHRKHNAQRVGLTKAARS